MATLNKHVKSDKVKWVITLLVGLLLIGAIIGLFIKLDRQTSTTTIGGEAYSIGLIDDTGANESGDTAIYLREAITTDGLTCKLAKDAKISYQLFYYDKDGKFLSASDVMTADFDSSDIPEGAESVRIMITPTDDEDGKVTFTEVLGYANQLIVTVNR